MSDVKGLSEVFAAIERLQRAVGNGGAVDQGAREAAEEGATYAAAIVPRRSGTLARAQTVFEAAGAVTIGIDPAATSPTGARPYVYGPIVARRGVDFYAQVTNQRGTSIEQRVFDALVNSIEN